MYRSICICVASLLVNQLLNVQAIPDDLYSDKYDHINADDILPNEANREQYYNCFMDKGPCVTEDAIYFKGNLPEAVATECRRCTDKQKENFGKIAAWYTDNKPDEWNALIAKLLDDAKKLNIQN